MQWLNHSLRQRVPNEAYRCVSYKSHVFMLCSNDEIQMTLLDTTLIFGLSVAGNPMVLTKMELFFNGFIVLALSHNFG